MLLVSHAIQARREFDRDGSEGVREVNGIAHSLFAIFADKKMCRAFVLHSPGTIRQIFLEFANYENSGLVAADFARNLTVAALAQPESFIYTESAGREGGAIAQYRAITGALYGNYSVVESAAQGIGHFDVRFKDHRSWPATEFQGYCDIALVHVESSAAFWMDGRSSRALFVALEVVKSNVQFLSFSESTDLDFYSENSRKLWAVVEFLSDTLHALNTVALERNLTYHQLMVLPGGAIKELAKLFLTVCHSVSHVDGNPATIWSFYHNRFWGRFFDLTIDGPAKTAFVRIAFRLILKEVKYLEEMSHYGSARLLRMLLTVLGLAHHGGSDTSLIAMGRLIRYWTKKNFMSLDRRDPEIADFIGQGMLKFDREQKRISKTYLGRNAHSDYLLLD